MDLAALGLTLRLATVTTLCLLILGTPLAFWISSQRTIGRRIAQAAIALPLVLPPTVLGFYLLVWLGPARAPGRALIHLSIGLFFDCRHHHAQSLRPRRVQQ